ncbi:hypothetical protein BGX21_009437 [Mortierella sp. AD011]|nr:hypothetical protein BGX20_010125 [Mortierella sp. AD010]KAF9402605.1 hypothetical protein BGX21_009437 [Mortierella sp. AD011]
MGTAGLNSDFTYQNSTGCLLYMTVDNKSASFSSTYCQFPVIGTGVIAMFDLFFLGYCAAVVQRYDEYLPETISLVFMGFSVFMAMFSFAICGEIGIGLNIACRTTSSGNSLSQCLANSSFQAMYTAQVCAGLMGGFWIAATILEYIQLRKRTEYENEQYAHDVQAYAQDQETTEYSHHHAV